MSDIAASFCFIFYCGVGADTRVAGRFLVPSEQRGHETESFLLFRGREVDSVKHKAMHTCCKLDRSALPTPMFMLLVEIAGTNNDE